MSDATSTPRGLTALPHGIDITAPGGITALLDLHRATFGDWRMSDEDGEQPPADSEGGSEVEQPPGEQQAPPEGTPVADMTVEQQAAYWKSRSRQNESRAAATKRELDQLKQATLTEAERAVEAARNEGRAAALAEVGSTAVSAFIKGRVSAGLLSEERAEVLAKGINTAAFVTDTGDVDLDGLKAYLDAINPMQPSPHQGNRGTNRPKSGLAAGAELYTSKHS